MGEGGALGRGKRDWGKGDKRERVNGGRDDTRRRRQGGEAPERGYNMRVRAEHWGGA